MFAWSNTDMKGLDPQYYQHQIHLHQDARPVQQRRYRMNPKYADKVNEDGFGAYNQIRMHPDDQEKKAFVTE